MDNAYLQELIDQTVEKGGGLLLNLNDKPAVVVLTVEKYNELLNNNVLNQVSNLLMASPSLDSLAEQFMERQKILVTGGAGYIGAHLAKQLLNEGYDVVVLDNLSSGKRTNVPEGAVFVEGDLGDLNLLRDLFSAHKFSAVMHMAASIEVEESVREPEKYLENNLSNTVKLLRVMNESGVKRIIFSSTAAVYGDQKENPIKETAGLRPASPYGFSKLLAEKAIKYYAQYLGFNATVFRYFNACGADFDGDVEATHQTHLIPIVLEVASGERKYIKVNGSDYQTPDGTCERDFIHVLDIVQAHLLALKQPSRENFVVYNIGTGSALSVLEVINSAAEVLNRMIPMEMGERREGDPERLVADNSKIVKELGFTPKYSDPETIIKTSWKQLNLARLQQ